MAVYNRHVKSAGWAAFVLGAWLGWASPAGAVPCVWTPLSTTVFDGALDARPTDAVWDSSGNLIVIGYMNTSAPDWEIRKYDSTLSVLLASTIYGSPSFGNDIASSVALDGSGNVVVAGSEVRAIGGFNWLVRTYDADLTTVLASTTYDGPAGGSDGALAVAVATNGDIVVAGVESGATGGTNWRINRYDAAFETLIATTTYDGPGGLSDEPWNMAIDGAGNIVVAGRESLAGGELNWRIRLYDGMLSTVLASTDYDTSGTGNDWVDGLVIHPSGDVYVGGIDQLVSGNHWRIRRYDSALSVLKSTTIYGAGSGGLNDLAIDSLGNVIAGGMEVNRHEVNVYDATLGVLVSSTRLDYGLGGAGANAVAVDPVSGRIASVGEEPGGNLNWRINLLPSGFSCLRAEPFLSPQAVSVGKWFRVIVSVTNTGSGPVTGVTADLQVNSGSAFLVPIDTPTGGAISLAAGGATAFTWTWSSSGVGFMSFTTTVYGTDAGLGDLLVVSGTVGTTSLAAAELSTRLSIIPAAPVMGQLAQLRLSVTNTGGVHALSVTPVLQANAGAGLISVINGPVPASMSLPPGNATTFAWTFTVTGFGTLGFTATASGIDFLTGNGIATAASLSATTVGVVQLSASPWLAPGAPSVGQPGTITFCVTNTGGAALVGASATVFFTTGANRVSILSGPVPAAPFTITAGGSVAVVWSCSFTAAGTVVMTVSMTGTDAGTGSPVVLSRQHIYSVLAAGALAATAWATPSPVSIGSWLTVRLTLTNTGGVPVTGVIAQAQSSTSMVLIAGPLPPGPVTLAPGSATTFFWTYSVSGASSFSLTASAYDSGTGNLIPVYRPLSPTVLLPAQLAARLFLSPGQPTVGQHVSVRLSVTNTGGIAAQTVSPMLQVNAGAGLVTSGIGPFPASVATILPGGTTTYAWSYTVTGAGLVSFTATASGVEAGSGNPLAVSASVSATTAGVVQLTGTLWVAPTGLSVGQIATLTLTITNTGSAALNGTTATASVLTGSNRAALIAGPFPGGPVAIPPGGVQTFTWTLSTYGAGVVVLSATATGTEAGSGATRTVTGSVAITVTPSGSLTATVLLTPGAVPQGDRVTVQLLVTNTGGVAVTGIRPAIAVTGPPGNLGYVTGPLPSGPVTLAPLSSTVFVWTYTVTGAGGFNLTATGYDGGTGAQIVVAAAAASTSLAPADLDAGLALSPGSVPVGATMYLTLTVTNTGGTGASVFVSSVSIGGGPGFASSLYGPLPPNGWLAPGDSLSAVFAVQVTGGGPGDFTLTVTGVQTGGSATVPRIVTIAPVIIPGARLEATVTVTPKVARIGRWVVATVAVKNTGAVGAYNVSSALQPSSDRVELVSVPALQFLLIPSGGAAEFSWTYSVSGVGETAFKAVVTGFESISNAAIGTGAEAFITTPRAAEGRLIAAPNILELEAPGSGITFYARGTPGGRVTLAIFDTGGGRVGEIAITLEANGEGRAILGAAVGARALPPGMYWAVASGGGVTGRTRFAVVRRK